MTHFRDTILIQLSFVNPSHTWGPPPPLWGRVKQDGGPFFKQIACFNRNLYITLLLLANVSTRRQFDED